MLSDEQYMRRALELARAGTGLASPNPCVGAVVVDSAGRIVGEGTHLYEGRKHAEVLALEQAGERARGATLYLNLEPCCHKGRTGPCSSAVIAAGIRRVVAGMADPNPRVAGQGFAKMRAAGVEVVSGVCEQEARKLNEAFSRWILSGRPLVTLKCAMTLDGKIASQSGCEEDRWITGEAARASVQELRHASDAILAGVGTVISDDPLLTDRSGRSRRRPLLRVVLDSHLRIPRHSRLVSSADGDLLIFCTERHDPARRKVLEQRGVRVVQVADRNGYTEISEVIAALGREQVLSLIIEGGSAVNTTALQAGVVDKMFLYYAPKIMGEGVPFVAEAGKHVLHCTTFHRYGPDFAIEGYLRDPYAEYGEVTKQG